MTMMMTRLSLQQQQAVIAANLDTCHWTSNISVSQKNINNVYPVASNELWSNKSTASVINVENSSFRIHSSTAQYDSFTAHWLINMTFFYTDHNRWKETALYYSTNVIMNNYFKMKITAKLLFALWNNFL